MHISTNDLPGSKNSHEIANEIVELANSIKTRENNLDVSSIVAKKKIKNLKDKWEEHNSQLIQNHNINPLHHTNAKGLDLNDYGDKQLTRNSTILQALLKIVNICKCILL